MEPWRRSWRRIATGLPTKGLQALADALAKKDYSLIQRATFRFADQANQTVIAACPIGYCYWKADVHPLLSSAVTVRFDSRCFVPWFDNMPLDEARRELLPEVNRVLAQRAKARQKWSNKIACWLISVADVFGKNKKESVNSDFQLITQGENQ
jgi:hypothetical protein